MAASMGKSCPSLPPRCSASVSRLMVTPRVSGLERSQEKSLEPHFPEPVSSSTSSVPFPVSASGVPGLPRPGANGNGSRHNGSPKPPFLTLPGRSHSIYINNNRYVASVTFVLLKKRQTLLKSDHISSVSNPLLYHVHFFLQ